MCLSGQCSTPECGQLSESADGDGNVHLGIETGLEGDEGVLKVVVLVQCVLTGRSCGGACTERSEGVEDMAANEFYAISKLVYLNAQTKPSQACEAHSLVPCS